MVVYILTPNSGPPIRKGIAVTLTKAEEAGALCVNLDPRLIPVMTWWANKELDEELPVLLDFPRNATVYLLNQTGLLLFLSEFSNPAWMLHRKQGPYIEHHIDLIACLPGHGMIHALNHIKLHWPLQKPMH